ncbi:MAG: regulatory protein [Flavobacteriales bacterium]|jgi:regulatory protein
MVTIAMDDLPDYQKLKNTAIYYLSRREYSKQELLDKLYRKYGNTSFTEKLLNDLETDGLQDDERFTEVFVRYRIGQGKGPMKIQQELKQKGISGELVDTYLDFDESYWVERAKELLDRKFSALSCDDLKAKAKKVRFLVSRGFSYSCVISAIDHFSAA